MDLQDRIEKQIERIERIQRKLHFQSMIEKNYDENVAKAINEQDFDATFQRNLLVFKQYMPEVYKELKGLELKTWELKHNNNGHISIYNKEDDIFYYNASPYGASLSQVTSFSNYPSAFTLTWEEDPGEGEDFSHVEYMNKLVRISSEMRAREYSSVEQEPIHDINTLIVLGVGLGLHLDMIVTNFNLRNLFIYEPDIEVFHASLYVTDWAWIFDKLIEKNINFHLSLAITPEEFSDDLGQQMKSNLWHENVVTHVLSHAENEHFDETLAMLRKGFYRYFVGFGFFDDTILGIAHQVANLRKNLPILTKPKSRDAQFSNIPVFLVLNGPSLDSSIDIIRKYRDSAIVVAGGSTLGAMYEYGIKPDIYVAMERCRSTKELVADSAPAEFLKDIDLLTLNVIHPEMHDMFRRTGLLFKEGETATSLFVQGANQRAGGTIMEGAAATHPTVANLMSVWMGRLGFNTFYLFGCDLGAVDDEHHSRKSYYYDENGDDLELYSVSAHEHCIEEGNFGGKVVSSPIFTTSRFMLESFIDVSEDTVWYNTSHGVKIKGTTPLAADSIHLDASVDKQTVLNAIYSNMTNSEELLPVDDFIASLAIEDWEAYSDNLINFCIGANQVLTRHDAANFMREHWDTLNEGDNQHFKMAYKGSFHYQQSVIFTLLYNARDDQWKELFVDAYAVFSEYLQECKRRLRTHMFKLSISSLSDVL
ncbi:MAG: motility associated factor glycosyltransferase family protein [Hormoscilla sp. GUM202]|nr:motility associated factor glycosyltransferase family protein [Hormoscilla sp. GUM202]